MSTYLPIALLLTLILSPVILALLVTLAGRVFGLDEPKFESSDLRTPHMPPATDPARHAQPA
jgi:hypothetical protein